MSRVGFVVLAIEVVEGDILQIGALLGQAVVLGRRSGFVHVIDGSPVGLIALVGRRDPDGSGGAVRITGVVVFASGSVAGRFILNPFWSPATHGFLLLNILEFGATLAALDLEGLDVFDRTTWPGVDSGLISGANAGAGAGIYTVVVVECVFGLAMDAEIAVGPETGVVYLLDSAFMVDFFVISRGGPVCVGVLGVLFVLVEKVLIILAIRYGVTILELSLLGTTAGSARPSKASRRFLEEWRPDAVHVVGKAANCTVDGVVAGESQRMLWKTWFDRKKKSVKLRYMCVGRPFV